MSSLLAPAIRKTAARSPAMIHRAMFIITSFIEEYLHPTRQDRSPGCDTSEHPGTGTRARGGISPKRRIFWLCPGPTGQGLQRIHVPAVRYYEEGGIILRASRSEPTKLMGTGPGPCRISY